MAFLKYASAKIEGRVTSADLLALKGNPRFKTAAQGKLAEINEDKYYYFRARFVSACDHPKANPLNPWEPGSDGWGPNGNGDAFEMAELQKNGHTFSDAGSYWNHNNTDPNLAYGYVFAHRLDEDGGYIEGIIALERGLKFGHKRASDGYPFPDSNDVVAGIESGRIRDVSMGSMVESSICSICGNEAHNEYQYCEHIPFKCQKVAGKLCFEYNRGCNWFEVTVIPEYGQGAGQQEKIAPMTISASQNSFANNIKYVEGGAVMKKSVLSALKRVAQETVIKNSPIKSAKDAGSYGDNSALFKTDQNRAKKETGKAKMDNTVSSTAVDAGDYKLASLLMAELARRSGESVDAIAKKIVALDEEGLGAPGDVRKKMEDVVDSKKDAVETAETERVETDKVDLEEAAEIIQEIAESADELMEALNVDGIEKAEDKVEDKEEKAEDKEEDKDEKEDEPEMDLEGQQESVAPQGDVNPAQSGEANLTAALKNILYTAMPGLKAKHEAKAVQKRHAALKSELQGLYKELVAAQNQHRSKVSAAQKEVWAEKMDTLTEKIASVRAEIKKVAETVTIKNSPIKTPVDRGDYGSHAGKLKEDQNRAKQTTEKVTIKNSPIKSTQDRGDYRLASRKRTAVNCPVTGEPAQGAGMGDGDGSGPGKGPRSRMLRRNRRNANIKMASVIKSASEVERLVEMRKRVRASKLAIKGKIKALANINSRLAKMVRQAGILNGKDASAILKQVEAGIKFPKAVMAWNTPITMQDRGDYGSHSAPYDKDHGRTQGQTGKVSIKRNPMSGSTQDRGDYPEKTEKITSEKGSIKARLEAIRARRAGLKPGNKVAIKPETAIKPGDKVVILERGAARPVVKKALEMPGNPKQSVPKPIEQEQKPKQDLPLFGGEPSEPVDQKTQAALEAEQTGMAELQVSPEMNLFDDAPKGMEQFQQAVQARHDKLVQEAAKLVQSAGRNDQLLTTSLETAKEGNKQLEKRMEDKNKKPAFAALEAENAQLKKALAEQKRAQRIDNLITLALDKNLITPDQLDDKRKALDSKSDSQLDAIEAEYQTMTRLRTGGKTVPARPASAFGTPIAAAKGSNGGSLFEETDC